MNRLILGTASAVLLAHLASAADTACSALYQQCGGKDWTGECCPTVAHPRPPLPLLYAQGRVANAVGFLVAGPSCCALGSVCTGECVTATHSTSMSMLETDGARPRMHSCPTAAQSSTTTTRNALKLCPSATRLALANGVSAVVKVTLVRPAALPGGPARFQTLGTVR